MRNQSTQGWRLVGLLKGRKNPTRVWGSKQIPEYHFPQLAAISGGQKNFLIFWRDQ